MKRIRLQLEKYPVNLRHIEILKNLLISVERNTDSTPMPFAGWLPEVGVKRESHGLRSTEPWALDMKYSHFVGTSHMKSPWLIHI